MDNLKQRFAQLNDNELYIQYHDHANEYTDEALSYMQAELHNRNIKFDTDEKEIEKLLPKNLSQMDGFFGTKEIMLAQTLLDGEDIHYHIIKNNESVPNNSSISRYSLFVEDKKMDKTSSILAEQFIILNNNYTLKELSTLDKLLSLSFNELRFSEKELNEKFDVDFNSKERNILLSFMQKFKQNINHIEENTVLFYVDTLDISQSRLDKNKEITREDMLTILEIIKPFCQDESFPQELTNITKNILDFLAV